MDGKQEYGIPTKCTLYRNLLMSSVISFTYLSGAACLGLSSTTAPSGLKSPPVGVHSTQASDFNPPIGIGIRYVVFLESATYPDAIFFWTALTAMIDVFNDEWSILRYGVLLLGNRLTAYITLL